MGFYVDIIPLEPEQSAWTKADLFHRLLAVGDKITPDPEDPGEFYNIDGTLTPTPVENAVGDQWIVSVRLGYSEDRMAQIERLERIAESIGGQVVPAE